MDFGETLKNNIIQVSFLIFELIFVSFSFQIPYIFYLQAETVLGAFTMYFCFCLCFRWKSWTNVIKWASSFWLLLFTIL